MEMTKRIFGSLLLSFIAMACVAQETVKNDEYRKQDGEATTFFCVESFHYCAYYFFNNDVI